MPVLVLTAILVLVIGCGSSQRREQAPLPPDPAAAFNALETRLLNASVVSFDFHVSAEGAFEADLHGALHLGPAERVRLTASGHFGGQSVDLFLHSEGNEVEFGNGANRTSAVRPAHLRESIVIGFTRMGILHNLARLTSTRPPDRADGGVREWVTVGSFSAVAGGSNAFSFNLAVAGAPAGSASLEFDADDRPISRRQTVRFPSGEMHLVEQYSAFIVDP